MPVSEMLFTLVVFVLAGQRLLEVRHSALNEIQLRAEGGVEHVPHQMFFMKLLQGAWFVAMLAEVWILQRTPVPLVVLFASLAIIAGQALRYAAIRTLGPRWCVRVITLPNAAPVRSGLYRYLRHPNYLGVALEIAAFPLLHSAWISSVVFTALNGWLLTARIRAENEALARERPRRSSGARALA